jgi:hypothetical protein
MQALDFSQCPFNCPLARADRLETESQHQAGNSSKDLEDTLRHQETCQVDKDSRQRYRIVGKFSLSSCPYFHPLQVPVYDPRLTAF